MAQPPPATPAIDWDSLFALARQARARAYVPYSRFQVGAAILASDGRLVSGCNVENAAYPVGACAEAGAVSALVRGHDGETPPRIRAILITGSGPEPCWPCGACRQRIREFADADTRIAVADADTIRHRDLALDALLPHAFGPEALPDRGDASGAGG